MDTQLFTQLSVTEQRAYLLEVFRDVQGVYPIYKQIYDYLVSHETISEEVALQLFTGIEQLQDMQHQDHITGYYVTLMKKIDAMRLQEQQADKLEQDSAEDLLANL